MTVLSTDQKSIINQANPTNQELSLGDKLYDISNYGLVAVRLAVTAAANVTAATVTIPVRMRIVDVIVQCTATSGSGTLTLRTGTTAISDAIVCAVNHTMGRAGTLDDAQVAIAAGATLNAIANGANDRGVVYIIGQPY